ncbi:MAG: AAA family ATPase [Niabella sp.]
MVKKIVVIGPESTGKSTLCTQLASHYQTNWCPEYAREYLLKNGTGYSFDDLAVIARGQLALEENSIAKARETSPNGKNTRIFIDTDMYVMKVWCEFVFGQCHDFILDEIARRQYDLYLLCNIDLPWVKDELREYPDLETREKLFHFYKDLLSNQSTPWVIISGDSNQRVQMAIDAVEKYT